MSAAHARMDSAVADGGRVDARSYASAILNILDDASEEKARLTSTQRAILNILADASEEKARLTSTQRAILNILADSSEEKARLGLAQLAVLNILDDFDIEKKNVEQANVELRGEIAERARVELALRDATSVAEGANQELEAFSYSVAHDLRAPLRSVDGFSQALLEDYADRLDADGKKYLNHVRASAQRMAELIDDLLSLSRVTRAELRRERIDLSELVRSLLTRLRESQPDRQVEEVIQAGLVAHADPRLLDVVLTNLLGNAWKFTGKRPSTRIEFAAKA